MYDRPIYLDYAATTPIDPRVVEQMLPWLTERFGNPASNTHSFGWEAEDAVENAREEVARLIQASPGEIVWTSGATESNNLAIKGAAEFHAERGRHIVTVCTEHKAVLDTCQALERQGFEVTYLPVAPDGLLDPADFAAALRPDTILASVMAVNNEIGVIQDIPELGRICRDHGVMFHVDAAQATGKLAIDVSEWQVDLLSMSAHKTYGPKGVGALYVRRKPRVRIAAQIHGGGHEKGFRSGTLATHQIVGMGEAFRLARLEMAGELARIRALRDRLWNGISSLDQIWLNGDMQRRVPHNLNVSFAHVEGESLLAALRGVAVSSGSACTSASQQPSYVMKALGRSDELAHSAIRFSIGRHTTEADIDAVILEVRSVVERLRELSPLWDTEG